jgi:hypothetical protein
VVRAVDGWSARNPQHADPGPDGYRPTCFAWTDHLDPRSFERCLEAGSCILDHAGTGTITGTLGRCKPLPILTRRAHRTSSATTIGAR